jgi:DNA-directed RNA polymerase specialized sigma24 family protein
MTRPTAQETFVAVWMHASSYRGDATRAVVAVWDRLAQGEERAAIVDAPPDARDTAHHEQMLVEGTSGAPIEDRLAVRRALLRLPLEQRAAVTLCLICGFSHPEAAAIIGVPLGTVKSHVSRGRDWLREALEKTHERARRAPPLSEGPLSAEQSRQEAMSVLTTARAVHIVAHVDPRRVAHGPITT